MEKNTTNILRTKAMLNLSLSLKAPILIRNNSLASEESKAKHHL